MSELTVSVLALFSIAVLALAFRKLPGERWQVLATVPLRKHGPNAWTGVNLTWYGFISASSFVFAAGVLVFLAGGVGIVRWELLAATLPIALVGVPAAKLVARHVEKKPETLTIGGAIFVATLVTPLALLGIQRLDIAMGREPLPMLSLLTAICIAYSFGEGFGRLACISFGCCYGKPLSSLSPGVRRLFERLSFSFHGEIKKISYASGLEGVKVVPVQAMTATIYVCVGLLGTYLFLEGWHKVALVVTLAVTQGWRVYSETLRADYRGNGKFSAYQKMALFMVLYLGGFGLAIPVRQPVLIDYHSGFAAITSASSAVGLELLFVAIFFFTGWSKVTGSTMSFHVHRHKV